MYIVYTLHVKFSMRSLLIKALPMGMAFLGSFVLAAGPLHLCLCLEDSCGPEMAQVSESECSACCESESEPERNTTIWSSTCSQCQEMDWASSPPPAMTSDSSELGIIPPAFISWDESAIPHHQIDSQPFVRSSRYVVRDTRPRPEQLSILRI